MAKLTGKAKAKFLARMKKGRAAAKKSGGGKKKKTGMNQLYSKETYSIFASGRKQTKNLNVNSPPPESYSIVKGKTKAKKEYAEQKKLYHKVKMKKW